MLEKLVNVSHILLNDGKGIMTVISGGSMWVPEVPEHWDFTEIEKEQFYELKKNLFFGQEPFDLAGVCQQCRAWIGVFDREEINPPDYMFYLAYQIVWDLLRGSEFETYIPKVLVGLGYQGQVGEMRVRLETYLGNSVKITP